nr:MAG TPA: hypothetical protein [Inoviridae sp.]
MILILSPSTEGFYIGINFLKILSTNFSLLKWRTSK